MKEKVEVQVEDFGDGLVCYSSGGITVRVLGSKVSVPGISVSLDEVPLLISILEALEKKQQDGN